MSEKLMKKESIYGILLKATFIFIVLQPVFDLLSFLYIRGFIPVGISTYGKPLIIGLINIALLLTYKKQIPRVAVTYGLYLLLMVVHSLFLYGFRTETSVILHEIRFMINILYMLICYFDLKILYDEAQDKAQFTTTLKIVLLATFGLYILLFLVAVVTGTSGRTYEYSDALKQGYKGWMDSGQIFGHALCVCLPVITYLLLHNKEKNRLVAVLLKFAVALPVLVLCLIGTKVTYYIPVMVLASQLALEIFFAARDKKLKYFINGAICLACVAATLLAYPVIPVKVNIDINNSVLSEDPNEESLDNLLDKDKDMLNGDVVADDEPKNAYEKNLYWNEKALDKLMSKYQSGELHPADMRNKQLIFNTEKFKLSDIQYKIFGIGYLNQYDMAIERDVLCVLFSFGILGFLLVLARPVWLWLRSAFVIVKNLLKTDMLTLCLFEGFSMFFFISWFAGYTFIYTNFSIFLAVVMVLLNHGVNKISSEEGTK